MLRRTAITYGLLAALSVGASAFYGTTPAAANREPIFDGLYTSTRNVTAVLVCDESVWVGTEGGCSRWDAKNPAASKYTKLEGLPGNHVTAIVAGPQAGTVLIATTRGMAAFLDQRGKLTPAPDIPHLCGRVTAMAQADGQTYASIGRRLYMLQTLAGRRTWVSLGVEIPAEPRCLGRIHEAVWAGTDKGLFRLQADNWQPVVHSEDILAARVNALMARGDDLFVATVGGLFRLHEAEWTEYTASDDLPDNHVAALVASGETIYIATFGGGMALMRNGTIAPVVGSPGYITALAIGRDEATVWAGTQQQGIWSWHAPTWSRRLQRNELPENNITAIAALDAELWIGTFEHGVGRMSNGVWRSFGPDDGIGSEWINHITSGQGRVWARTSAGELFAYGSGKWLQVTKHNGLIKDWTSSVQTAGGNVWAGTWGAVSKFDGLKWHYFAPKPALESQVVTALAVLDRDIWVGTAKAGLCRYNALTRRWETYTLGSGLTDTWVTCLNVWQDALWVGTFSGGLCRYQQGEWKYFRAADVLPTDRINCLTNDDGLYVGTLDGLCRFDGSNWNSYGAEAGLPSEVVQTLAISGDHLWVGTPEGLAHARLVEAPP